MSTHKSFVTGVLGAVVPTVNLREGGLNLSNDPLNMDADTLPVTDNNDPLYVKPDSPLMVFAVPVAVTTKLSVLLLMVTDAPLVPLVPLEPV